MTKKNESRKQVKHVMTTPTEKSRDGTLLGTIAKPILLAIVAGICGVITTVMTPLSEVVSAFIWHPEPAVRIFPEKVTAKQGDLIRLDLFLYPTNKVAVPLGQVSVDYRQDLLQIGAETSTADLIRVTPEINTPLKITGDKPLEFVANLPGEGVVTATFTSIDGISVTSTSRIFVSPKEAATKPTYDKIRKLWDITGKWRIILSGAPGEMEIVDEGNNIKGAYKLRDGNSGTIDGWHDGDSFNFYFSRGTDNPTQLWTTGPFKKGPATELEINGKVLLRKPSTDSPTGWIEKSYGNGEFSAKAEM